MNQNRLASPLPAHRPSPTALVPLPVVFPAAPYRSRFKRLVDIIGVATLAIVTAPVAMLAILCVKLHAPRDPVLYRSSRIGYRGDPFPMWKIRTMFDDADRHESQLHGQRQGVFLKIEGDPRVTPIGRFLRKYSIDELPQLWNVLRGDMSLVGPRPLLPGDFDRLPLETQLERFSARPGITGLWQVSGRNDTSDERRMELDVEYVRRWTPWLDLEILARTVPAVLRADGAY